MWARISTDLSAYLSPQHVHRYPDAPCMHLHAHSHTHWGLHSILGYDGALGCTTHTHLPTLTRTQVRHIARNFIDDRTSDATITIGINAIREICARQPLGMDSLLLSDLVDYASHKDKAVVNAARSLLKLFRTKNPHMLRKKDRGRHWKLLDEAHYGDMSAGHRIPGVERLEEQEHAVDQWARQQQAKQRRVHADVDLDMSSGLSGTGDDCAASVAAADGLGAHSIDAHDETGSCAGSGFGAGEASRQRRVVGRKRLGALLPARVAMNQGARWDDWDRPPTPGKGVRVGGAGSVAGEIEGVPGRLLEALIPLAKSMQKHCHGVKGAGKEWVVDVGVGRGVMNRLEFDRALRRQAEKRGLVSRRSGLLTARGLQLTRQFQAHQKAARDGDLSLVSTVNNWGGRGAGSVAGAEGGAAGRAQVASGLAQRLQHMLGVSAVASAWRAPDKAETVTQTRGADDGMNRTRDTDVQHAPGPLASLAGHGGGLGDGGEVGDETAAEAGARVDGVEAPVQGAAATVVAPDAEPPSLCAVHEALSGGGASEEEGQRAKKAKTSHSQDEAEGEGAGDAWEGPHGEPLAGEDWLQLPGGQLPGAEDLLSGTASDDLESRGGEGEEDEAWLDRGLVEAVSHQDGRVAATAAESILDGGAWGGGRLDATLPIEAQRLFTDEDFERIAAAQRDKKGRADDASVADKGQYARVEGDALLGARKIRMSKAQQKADKMDARRARKAKGALGKRQKSIRNADRLRTQPLPMVWDKLRRQKKKEMDSHSSKRVARKAFRGHFHKTKRK